MREINRFNAGLGLALLIATSGAAESPKAIPKRASIVVVPSKFDAFLIQTGNVKVLFRDGHTEIWTNGGDCHDVHVSDKGNVGWIKMDKTSVDTIARRLYGNDILNIRLLDGTMKQFSPHLDAHFIEKWCFADDDTALVVRSMGHHGRSFYSKYDIKTGRMIDDVGDDERGDDERLPSWAKQVAQ